LGELRSVGDDGPRPERCRFCGALAVGPCASCRSPVCGDCCVLTEGGAKTWAICLACEKRGGTSLRGAWLAVLLWIGVPLLVLGAAVAALLLLRR
jgi:hypothetical protein